MHSGKFRLVFPVTFILASLICFIANAADYYKPPEFSIPGGTTIIHAGTLLAMPGEAAMAEQSIIVRAGKIVEIRPGYASMDSIEADDTTRIVDLSDKFVMPGLLTCMFT